jgi:hypothetical protein
MWREGNLYGIENRFSFVFSGVISRMMILWALFVLNRNDSDRGERLVACGAGAKLAEKLAIRKWFLVCCERVSLIFNIWRLAIRNCWVEGGDGALTVEARAAWTM